VKKIIVLFLIFAIFLPMMSCAGAQVNKSGMTGAEIIKAERENRDVFIKSISVIGGVVLGGLLGIFTASDSTKFASMLKGCAVGAAAGFGAGYVITENLKYNGNEPDSSRIDQYFNDK
jgi:hypothetical protein